jgi:hypothetical protein
MKRGYRYLVLICCLMLCSCAQIDSYIEKAKMAKLNEDCEKSIKDYNKLLRWREIENAGMLYMDRELRDDFMKSAEDIKKRGITITDYRILTMECLAEKKTADVVVDFDYYMLPSNRIKTLTYRQNWKYVDTEAMKGWFLKTSLPDFE